MNRGLIMSYKVLLTASGTGSRLGTLTQSMNKSLLSLGGRPVISHIIDMYPTDTEFVITLGYLGDQVKDFLDHAYEDRFFQYVFVDPYQGKGSSLGYSMLQARSFLEEPFVFHACDTLVVEPILPPEEDWIAGRVIRSGEAFDQYRTHIVKDGQILALQDKGVSPADSIHIGLVGIYSYAVFWKTLEHLYHIHSEDISLSDASLLGDMLRAGVFFKWVPYRIWLDTGNPEALQKTQAYFDAPQSASSFL